MQGMIQKKVQQRTDDEPFIDMSSLPACVSMDACATVTSGVLAHESAVPQLCLDMYLCGCLSSTIRRPEAPDFRSVSVDTNRHSAGTWVKEMSATDYQHQRKFFIPVCF